MKNIKVLILFNLVCFSLFSAKGQQADTVSLIDSYVLLKDQMNLSLVAEPLESKYLIGSVTFIMADSSIVTPSGVAVKVYDVHENEQGKLVTMATTNGKGVFYLTKMSLGCFKLSIANWGEVICERYFVLNDLNQKFLEGMAIPMEKIEEKTQQKKNYEEF